MRFSRPKLRREWLRLKKVQKGEAELLNSCNNTNRAWPNSRQKMKQKLKCKNISKTIEISMSRFASMNTVHFEKHAK